MSLIIEAGKFYKTRDGRKVGPAEAYTSHSDVYPMCRWVVNGYLYQNDGTFADGEEEHSFDLIAEWHEGPVRTVTRREIMPGVYDNVHVEDNPDAGLMFGMVTNNYTAHELRSAAMILSQLAEALDESKS